MSPSDTELRRLVDVAQVRDVVLRYARAIDRRDIDLLRTCYHPDAVDHHTGVTGDVEDFIRFLRTELAGYSITQHLVGQQYVELDGDLARCESYGVAVHRGHVPGDPGRDYTSGFRYVDRMERRAGTWRIAERFAVRDWTRDDSAVVRAAAAPGPTGSPGPDDPLYHLPGWPRPEETR